MVMFLDIQIQIKLYVRQGAAHFQLQRLRQIHYGQFNHLELTQPDMGF